MKTYRFYKDEYGWFVDLPEWEGEVWDLQMVAGADTLCDLLSQGESQVYITLSQKPFHGCGVLDLLYLGRLEGWELGEGAWYSVDGDFNVWLCNVTKFIFGDFPKKIYFK